MFRRRPLIEDDLWGWIQEHFEWVASERPDWWAEARLIGPTREFFAAPSGEDHDTALAVMADICRLTGVENRFLLDPLPELPEALAHEYGKLGEVAGTYTHDPDQPVIQYSPRSLRRPLGFINTMVHEVMHDRLAPYVDVLPGGAAAHELATDLHCIIAGFGAIQLSAAEESGWAGYMTQPSRAVALAEFLDRKSLEPEAADAWLTPRSRKLLRRAQRDL